MKYLCVCYYEEKKLEACTPEDFEEVARVCAPRDEALRKSGHLVLVGSLGLPTASKTIRAGESEPSVVDGPYAATREPFGAFFIVEAEDMDEAIRVASIHPGAHLGRLFGGGIEVRPIEMFGT